jgi:hypothetical protein
MTFKYSGEKSIRAKKQYKCLMVADDGTVYLPLLARACHHSHPSIHYRQYSFVALLSLSNTILTKNKVANPPTALGFLSTCGYISAKYKYCRTRKYFVKKLEFPQKVNCWISAMIN